MKRNVVSRGWALLGLACLAAATTGGAEAGQRRIAGIGPGTGVDVYIPNPDPQTPIAWSQGTEPPPPQGDYGGGFLQYMITGNETRPVPHPRVPPPYYPARVAPVQGYDGRTDLATHARPPAGDGGARYGAPAGYAERASARTSDNRLTLFGIPLNGPAAARSYDQPADSEPTYRPAAASYGPVAQRVEAEVDPMYRRQEVAYAGRESAGTVVIDTADKFLYLVEDGGRAMRYGIGVGRPGFMWAGAKTITRKAEWPDWTPPSDMLVRRPDLPRHMDGGIANPLGARALYLGSSLYRIHGTNEPDTIGTNVSSGCIRLVNEDVADLYSRVRVGTRVIVM